jgi:DNA-binding NarL/FixJ family response regulator
VLTPGCGEVTVDHYKRHCGEIGKVVLDTDMAGFDRRETFRQIRSINPRVVVNIAIGCSHDRDADDLLEQRAAGFAEAQPDCRSYP